MQANSAGSTSTALYLARTSRKRRKTAELKPFSVDMKKNHEKLAYYTLFYELRLFIVHTISIHFIKVAAYALSLIPS